MPALLTARTYPGSVSTSNGYLKPLGNPPPTAEFPNCHSRTRTCCTASTIVSKSRLPPNPFPTKRPEAGAATSGDPLDVTIHCDDPSIPLDSSLLCLFLQEARNADSGRKASTTVESPATPATPPATSFSSRRSSKDLRPATPAIPPVHLSTHKTVVASGLLLRVVNCTVLQAQRPLRPLWCLVATAESQRPQRLVPERRLSCSGITGKSSNRFQIIRVAVTASPATRFNQSGPRHNEGDCSLSPGSRTTPAPRRTNPTDRGEESAHAIARQTSPTHSLKSSFPNPGEGNFLERTGGTHPSSGKKKSPAILINNCPNTIRESGLYIRSIN